MRFLLAALGVVAAIGAARADEPYALPAVGAELTYRMVTILKVSDRTTVTGQIYTYKITGVASPTFEATVKPLALIYGCTEGAANKDCAFAGKVAGATRDGDLVTLPIPDALGDSLARESIFKGRYFLVEERKFPLPGAKNPDDPNSVEFGDTPVFVLSNTLSCDYAPLKDFVPLGQTAHATLSCRNIFSRTQSRIGSDQHAEEPISVELSDNGADKITLPSGTWDVRKVGIKFVPTDGAHAAAQGESDVAAKLGIAVKTHSILTNPATHLTSETTSEMIAFKP